MGFPVVIWSNKKCCEINKNGFHNNFAKASTHSYFFVQQPWIYLIIAVTIKTVALEFRCYNDCVQIHIKH